jgi:hypothetical protein
VDNFFYPNLMSLRNRGEVAHHATCATFTRKHVSDKLNTALGEECCVTNERYQMKVSAKYARCRQHISTIALYILFYLGITASS